MYKWAGWRVTLASMRRPAPALAAMALAAAACTSTAKLHVTSPPVGWTGTAAQQANGSADHAPLVHVCGSDADTYLLEMLHTRPTDLKVLREWGDLVDGGKQVMVEGTVAATHLGPTDLPMSHVFGDDLSMDVNLDPPFTPFALKLGKEKTEAGPGQVHVELSSGLIPHVPRAFTTEAKTWRQVSDFNLTAFQPGFDQPAIGDRIAVMGRWIIDCGHPDFAAELHPMTFVAWSHQTGSTTTVRAYLNPYRDSQLYSPDESALGQVTDPGRLTASTAKPFPPFFIDEVLRLATGQVDRLNSRELLDANRASPAGWQVCAPAMAGGAHVKLAYDVVHRPGVDFTATLDSHTGCAAVATRYTADYRPLDVPVHQCALPWSYLDQAAAGAISGGVKVLPMIEQYVPAPARALVARDPTTACAEAVAGPAVSATPAGRQSRTNADQPIPFYGVITVTRTP